MKNKKILKIAIVSLLVMVCFGGPLALAQWNPDNLATDSGLPSSTVTDIVEGIMLWVLAMIGIVAVIAFSIAGFQYLTAAGNEKQAETAKKNMTYAIIGVIVALSGLIVIYAVDSMLSGSGYF